MLAGRVPPAADPALAKAIAGLSKKAPSALRLANELIDLGLRGSLEDGLRLELGRLREIFSTDDAREGIAALLERRAAAFTGK
jgi:enoyl-CoA hydratase/carnithine racemase